MTQPPAPIQPARARLPSAESWLTGVPLPGDIRDLADVCSQVEELRLLYVPRLVWYRSSARAASPPTERPIGVGQ